MLYNISMNEIREDLGYHDEMPSAENQAWMKAYLAGTQPKPDEPKPPRDARHPDEDWQISDEARAVGSEGLATARHALGERKQHEKAPHRSMPDARLVDEARHLQSIGAVLTPQQQRALAKYYREQEREK
jgi:hypothetical protein